MSEGQAGTAEIEITPAMIDAGVTALMATADGDLVEPISLRRLCAAVVSTYRSMWLEQHREPEAPPHSGQPRL